MSIRSLNTTSIYRHAEEASHQSLTRTVMAYSLLKEGTIEIMYDDIADVMFEITGRTSPFSAKYAVDSLLKKGRIQLVYNENLRLVNAVPFFKKQVGSKITMVVNITNFAAMRPDGSINMNPNTLYALLLSAAFELDMDNRILSFVRDTYIMYARLFSNVIAGLSFMDNVKKEKIQYLAANFFYYQIYSPDKTFINNYKSNLKYNSDDTIEALENKIPLYGDQSGYESLEIFIDNLVKIFPEMKKLSFRNFIDKWSSAYGSSALFACEYIPYFFYMIISSACLSPIVNTNKISIEVSVNLAPVYKRIEQAVIAMAG